MKYQAVLENYFVRFTLSVRTTRIGAGCYRLLGKLENAGDGWNCPIGNKNNSSLLVLSLVKNAV